MPARKRPVVEQDGWTAYVMPIKGGAWRFRLHDPDGNRVKEGRARTRDQAYNRARAEIAARTAPQPVVVATVGDLIDEHVEHLLAGADGVARSPATKKKILLRAGYVSDELRAMPAAEVGRSHVNAELMRLTTIMSTSSRSKDKPLGAQTRRDVVRLLKGAWDHADLSANPWASVRTTAGSSGRKVPKPLAPEDRSRLAAAILRASRGEGSGWRQRGGADVAGAQVRAAAWWAVALRVGLRAGELAGAGLDGLADDLSRLELTHGVVPYDPAEPDPDVVVVHGGLALVTRLKTDDSAAAVPIPTDLRPLLSAWLEVRRQWQQQAEPGVWQDHGRLFCTQRGRLVAPRNARRDLDRLVADAGIAAAVNPHRLRDTALTDLHESGADLRTIQAVARHSGPRMTAGYVRAAEDRAAAALESGSRLDTSPDEAPKGAG